MTRNKLRPVADFVKRVANGNGADRLPAQVRAIDVVNFRPGGASRTQSITLKKVLPRVKYANQHVTINYDWAPQVVDRSKVNGQRPQREDRKRLVPKANEAQEGGEVQPEQQRRALLRLHFTDGLPSADVRIRDDLRESAIALRLLTAAKRGVMPEEEREAYRPRPAAASSSATATADAVATPATAESVA